ncbi:MAG: hypothetical protein KDA81_21685, partial [Planctomycetaceae bacterium]|nr:hypothetical protein [Planctomycetaceae bacterium]
MATGQSSNRRLSGCTKTQHMQKPHPVNSPDAVNYPSPTRTDSAAQRLSSMIVIFACLSQVMGVYAVGVRKLVYA